MLQQQSIHLIPLVIPQRCGIREFSWPNHSRIVGDRPDPVNDSVLRLQRQVLDGDDNLKRNIWTILSLRKYFHLEKLNVVVDIVSFCMSKSDEIGFFPSVLFEDAINTFD